MPKPHTIDKASHTNQGNAEQNRQAQAAVTQDKQRFVTEESLGYVARPPFTCCHRTRHSRPMLTLERLAPPQQFGGDSSPPNPHNFAACLERVLATSAATLCVSFGCSAMCVPVCAAHPHGCFGCARPRQIYPTLFHLQTNRFIHEIKRKKTNRLLCFLVSNDTICLHLR